MQHVIERPCLERLRNVVPDKLKARISSQVTDIPFTSGQKIVYPGDLETFCE